MAPDSDDPWRPDARHAAGVLAALSALVVFLLATEVFQYHTTNHDEAVYLQQAAMFLEGQLTLQPPVPEAFRPWFFVADGGAFYPKYAPVPAAMFAVGEALGEPRIALALIAGATVWLTYATVAEVVDRPTGVVAAVLLLASPLFLVQASVFLPYVPTLALNLCFAWAYLRADRTGDRRFAALAGIAVGLAFFARPFTAVLFALPFVGHAIWTMRELERSVVRRHLLTAALGLAGVGITLAYNALVTGSPLTFPYEAFDPNDGLGFGYHSLLGSGTDYSIPLAIESGLQNIAAYVTRWSVAAPLGVLLALGGLAIVVRDRATRFDGRVLAIAGLFVTVPVGELYFWGTRNVLGDLDVATDGLIHTLGPYYHLDLLLPTVTFAAVALVAAGRRFRAYASTIDEPALEVGGAVLVTLVAFLLVGATLSATAAPLGDNAEVTDRLERAYEPVESADFEHALVYLPTVYEGWLNHPFQHLRNDPGYDGPAVYALDVRPFAVADAYPERQLYRYAYRGVWNPRLGDEVTPRLQSVERVEGSSVTLDLSAAVPRFAETVSIQVGGETDPGYATVSDPGDHLPLTLTASGDSVQLRGQSLDAAVTVPVADREDVELRLFVDRGGVAGLTYRVDLPLRRQGDDVEALTPRLEVCTQPDLCGGAAAYVPGAHGEGVGLNATLRAGGT